MEAIDIEPIEDTPELTTKKCRIVSMVLSYTLSYTTIIVALITLFLYDYFISIAMLLLSFIVMGIIRSKIRNSVIPPAQREFQYSDRDIAIWFSAKELCFWDILN